MSDTRKLFKLLLNKDFYTEFSNKLPVQSFDEFGLDLLDTVKVAYEKLGRDLTCEDVLQMHIILHPVITTAQRNSIEAYLERVKNEGEINTDMAKLVYASAWKAEVGRKVAQFGIELSEGKYDTLEGLHDYLNSVTAEFTPKEVLADPVDTDPTRLFAKLAAQGKWTFNIPVLNNRIKRISGGTLIILLARPESGKTACVVNLIAGREGFAAQGATVHLLCNEEGAEVTAGRATCCFNEVSFEQLRENPKLADNEHWHKVREKLTFIHRPEITLSQLDTYCKKHKPDILVVDQLDHLGMNESFEKGHERLGAIYRRTREIASKHNCVIIGVSQASAEAEDKSKVTYAMAEGSKTAKAAAADAIIGIGKVAEGAEGEGNSVLRYFTVSKNKISGWKGTITCRLIQDQSRFAA